jgi:hypothetical protein
MRRYARSFAVWAPLDSSAEIIQAAYIQRRDETRNTTALTADFLPTYPLQFPAHYADRVISDIFSFRRTLKFIPPG